MFRCKQRFPQFETWREITATSNDSNAEPRQAANAAFAFPSHTEADDVLHFPKRNVNYHIRVRYYDYKLFASTVSVKELDQRATQDQPATLDQPTMLTARKRP